MAGKLRPWKAPAEFRVAALLSLALLLPAGATACREGPAEFISEDRPRRENVDAVRLTYSINSDRSPAWSTNGDSVYYVAEGYGELPSTPGVLLTIPAEGGVASPLLPDVQINTTDPLWLTTPRPAPGVPGNGSDDGSGTAAPTLAYVEVGNHVINDACNAMSPLIVNTCSPHPRAEVEPRMVSVRLHVRELEATGPAGDDATLDVVFEGFKFDETRTAFEELDGMFVFRDHPFQQLIRGDSTFIYRPTWAPDAERIAYSDGLGLHVWEPGTDVDATVPNTGDGVSPAWSPTGEWIAFTSLERADSASTTCTNRPATSSELICALEQTIYTVGRRTLTLVSPATGTLAELTEGEEAAWSPDGEWIFYRGADEIRRIRVDGSADQAVPGTTGGRDPAVSPDGTRLAFSRRTEGSYDVWVVALETP